MCVLLGFFFTRLKRDFSEVCYARMVPFYPWIQCQKYNSRISISLGPEEIIQSGVRWLGGSTRLKPVSAQRGSWVRYLWLSYWFPHCDPVLPCDHRSASRPVLCVVSLLFHKALPMVTFLLDYPGLLSTNPSVYIVNDRKQRNGFQSIDSRTVLTKP